LSCHGYIVVTKRLFKELCLVFEVRKIELIPVIRPVEPGGALKPFDGAPALSQAGVE